MIVKPQSQYSINLDMKELEYPYKKEYILAHKKSLKNELLNNRDKFLDLKIAVLCGSTVNEMIDILELLLLKHGIKPTFYVSEYNRYYEEAVFDNASLKSFDPDVIYIFTSFRNIRHDFDLSTNEAEISRDNENEFKKYKTIWETIKKNYRAIIIQNNFELPSFRLLGNKDIYDPHGLSNYIHKLNTKFYDYISSTDRIYICDINYIAADYGLNKWHNEKLYALYKIPCDMLAYVDIANAVSNIIKSLYGMNKKALVLDLDNTLWGGIIGEDGVNGVEVGPETAVGELYLSFQKYIKKIKSLGVLLNIVSKNNEADAYEGLEETSGILKKDDFISIIANWLPKDKNVSDTAKKLNIGEDSIVFVDDNPMERDIVVANTKAVVPAIDNVENYIRIIDRNSFFEVTNYTKEDFERSKLYKANIEREEELAKYDNYDDYLDSLDMVAEIVGFNNHIIDRVTQLINKSNQFNLTTKRYSIEDVKKISEDSNYITLVGKLVDKFGDNGIVSIIIGRIENDTLHIDLLLMSCRVLMRDMEYAMLDTLVSICARKNVKKIKGYYIPSKKNMMVKDLYEKFGFKKIGDDEGNIVWELKNLNQYKNQNRHIKKI